MSPLLRNLYVKGEVSYVNYHSNGLIYMDLKDEKSMVKCVIYPRVYRKLDFKIDSGSEGKLILSITTDSGVKIDVDRIFDRFYKQDSSRTQGGAGLGLYICKRFAEMMGGNISAEQDEENFIIKLELPVSE